MNPALQGLLTIIIGVGGCVGYFYFSNVFLDKVLYPAKGPNAGRNINRANAIRPWLFLFPALFALGLYLAYPVVETLRLSLLDRVQGGRALRPDRRARSGPQPAHRPRGRALRRDRGAFRFRRPHRPRRGRHHRFRLLKPEKDLCP